ncbi:hypothetical protein [uncultured Duncaniella sp.]|uniref:hypothetical protein n=1 Tax=uncultured Duncaniella sp. TaxID=2768039 RepID=UPI00260F7272|nr:hypothetical protein [uncultured Duncaniella sp.]
MTDERSIQLIYQLAGQPSETKTVAEWAQLLKDQGLELCSFCQFRPNCPKHNYILKPRAPRPQPRCWFLDDPDVLISATSVATLVSTGAHLPPDAVTRHPGIPAQYSRLARSKRWSMIYWLLMSFCALHADALRAASRV